jgi:hypothetical protein
MGIVSVKTEIKNDLLKKKIIEMTKQLLSDFKTDMESGVADGTYNKAENIQHLEWIAESEKEIAEFEAFNPTVYVFVEGGNIQGASADSEMNFELYDKDILDAGDVEAENDYIESHGTLQEWNAMIKNRTDSGELKPIY